MGANIQIYDAWNLAALALECAIVIRNAFKNESH